MQFVKNSAHAVFFLALNFAQRALWAAAIFRRADADIVRLGFVTAVRPFSWARRAFCARLIFFRAAADTVRLGSVYDVAPSNFPKTERAASTCFSWFNRFVLSTRNSETIDTRPCSFDMSSPRAKLYQESAAQKFSSRIIWLEAAMPNRFRQVRVQQVSSVGVIKIISWFGSVMCRSAF